MSTEYFITGVLTCMVLALMPPVQSQTRCSIRVPVPNMGYCDAVGALEENTDGSVHETRGRIENMKDYQVDAFKLFDQQFTTIMNDSVLSDADIKDIEEEINTLTRIINNMYMLETTTELPSQQAVTLGRAKRAAKPSLPAAQQQLLDAAKLSFQQALASVLAKLQNVSRVATDDEAKNTAFHARLQQELTTNQRALNILEKQLINIDSDIQSALTNRRNISSTGSSPSLTGVQQSVTDLVINATVAEKLAQRQLDTLEKTVNKMVQDEASVTAGITTLKTGYTNFTSELGKEEVEVDNLVSGERFVENQIQTFITDKTQDIANIRAQLAPEKQKLRAAGMSVANSIIALGQFEQDLIPTRNAIDGTQSLVTLTKKAQLTQIGDILNLKRSITDSINAMKYAFGIISKLP